MLVNLLLSCFNNSFLQSPIKEKIEIIAKKVYGADGVEFSNQANKMIEIFEKQVFLTSDLFSFFYISFFFYNFLQ